jgi:putative endonuclease
MRLPMTDKMKREKAEGINNDTWHVYMVRCSDGTLYTGITNDLEKRIKAHNSGKDGARYTRSRRPVKLVYSEEVDSKSTAAKLEYKIKKMTRAKKMEMIERIG